MLKETFNSTSYGAAFTSQISSRLTTSSKLKHNNRHTTRSKSSKPLMAYSKVVSRLSSRLQPFTHKLTKMTSSPASELSSLKSSLHFQAPAPVRRTVRISRLPLELSSVESMMPLHNANASARLVSSLSIESQSWGLVPQGISMPL